MRLEDKVALITGAASGMGASMARVFAREGAKVVIADMLAEEGAVNSAASPNSYLFACAEADGGFVHALQDLDTFTPISTCSTYC